MECTIVWKLKQMKSTLQRDSRSITHFHHSTFLLKSQHVPTNIQASTALSFKRKNFYQTELQQAVTWKCSTEMTPSALLQLHLLWFSNRNLEMSTECTIHNVSILLYQSYVTLKNQSAYAHQKTHRESTARLMVRYRIRAEWEIAVAVAQ